MNVKITKLNRRIDPENPFPAQVNDGQSVIGAFMVPTEEAIDWMKQEDDVQPPEKLWEEPEALIPKINEPILIRSDDNWAYLRTSKVRSYYVHETDGSEPDKLILPKDFPVHSIHDLPQDLLVPGDLLMATMNSIYLLRKV
jgi:hypothetical protein